MTHPSSLGRLPEYLKEEPLLTCRQVPNRSRTIPPLALRRQLCPSLFHEVLRRGRNILHLAQMYKARIAYPPNEGGSPSMAQYLGPSISETYATGTCCPRSQDTF